MVVEAVKGAIAEIGIDLVVAQSVLVLCVDLVWMSDVAGLILVSAMATTELHAHGTLSAAIVHHFEKAVMLEAWRSAVILPHIFTM